MRSVLKTFETFTDKEEYIRYSWISFTTHIDKPRALWYAYNAEKFLDGQQLSSEDEDELLDKVYRKGLGYHVIAMVYVWNEWFEEAFSLEQYFLTRLYWHAFGEGIRQYLELLIVKKQRQQLEKIFADVEFRYCFLNHYEVFISLLIDPTHRITRMNEFVPVVNRVNGLNKTYGDGERVW